MKFKKLTLISLACLSFSLTSCNISGNNRFPEIDDGEIQRPDDEEDNDLEDLYKKAIASGNFKGTYEEWLSFISGESGDLNVNKPVTKDEILKAEYKKAIDSGNYNGTYEEWLSYITGKDGVINPTPIDPDEALKSLYHKAIESNNFVGTYEEWIKRISGEGGSLMPVDPVDKDASLKEAYNKAVESKNYTGTYEEWLSFIKGENGPLIKEEHTYNLTINFDNDTTKEVRTYHKNEVVDIQNPTKDGYKFLNWTNQLGEVICFPLNINADIEITANYERTYVEAIFMHNGEVLNSTKYDVGFALESLPSTNDLNLSPNEYLLYWYYLDNEQEIQVHLPYVFLEAKDYVFYPKIDSFNPNDVNQNLKANITYYTNSYGTIEMNELNDQIAKFNEIYPNIVINAVQAGRLHDIHKRIKQDYITCQDLPNIYDSSKGYTLEFEKFTDKTLNLSAYKTNTNYGLGTKFENGTVVLDENTKDTNLSNFVSYYRELSSMPFKNTGYLWYVNQDEIQENPVSGLDVIQKARDLKKKYPERYTSNKFAPIAIKDLVNFFHRKRSKGTFPFVDLKNNYTPEFNFNNVDVKASIKKFKSLYDEGLILTDSLRRANGGSLYIEDDFVKDNPTTFMLYSTTLGIKYLIDKVDNTSANNTLSNNIAKVQFVDATYDECSSKVLGFFKHKENENIASWLFYKFLLTYKPTTLLDTKLRYPLTTSFYKDNAVYDDLITNNLPIQKEDDRDTRITKLYAQSAHAMHTTLKNYFLDMQADAFGLDYFNDSFESVITDVLTASTDNFDLYLTNALNKLEADIKDYYATYTF